MDYDINLKEQFGKLKISLVRHDTSPTGFPCYIEVQLEKTPKDKGALVLDLGNYIYRTTGLRYQMTPEYRGKGKKTTIRWFMSWNDVQPILVNIQKAFGFEAAFENYIPSEFRNLIIQDVTRGIAPRD